MKRLHRRPRLRRHRGRRARASRPAATTSPRPPCPRLTVTRMEDDAPYELAQLASAEKPTLLWFWAPWCSVCNGEAAEIQQLAAETDAFDVVAIGGRDELANAPAFVERHGMTAPTMLFDETMQVWEHYRIPGQPGAILLDTDGVERGRWLGAFDTTSPSRRRVRCSPRLGPPHSAGGGRKVSLTGHFDATCRVRGVPPLPALAEKVRTIEPPAHARHSSPRRVSSCRPLPAARTSAPVVSRDQAAADAGGPHPADTRIGGTGPAPMYSTSSGRLGRHPAFDIAVTRSRHVRRRRPAATGRHARAAGLGSCSAGLREPRQRRGAHGAGTRRAPWCSTSRATRADRALRRRRARHHVKAGESARPSSPPPRSTAVDLLAGTGGTPEACSPRARSRSRRGTSSRVDPQRPAAQRVRAAGISTGVLTAVEIVTGPALFAAASGGALLAARRRARAIPLAPATRSRPRSTRSGGSRLSTAASPRNTIPAIAAPTAPIPVHTA